MYSKRQWTNTFTPLSGPRANIPLVLFSDVSIDFDPGHTFSQQPDGRGGVSFIAEGSDKPIFKIPLSDGVEAGNADVYCKGASVLVTLVASGAELPTLMYRAEGCRLSKSGHVKVDEATGTSGEIEAMAIRVYRSFNGGGWVLVAGSAPPGT